MTRVGYLTAWLVLGLCVPAFAAPAAKAAPAKAAPSKAAGAAPLKLLSDVMKIYAS